MESMHNGVTEGFKRRFDQIAGKLRLAEYLSNGELNLLRQASFYAALCNISFNGFGGCNGLIKPERERHRTHLEQTFMAAKQRACSTPGWLTLPEFCRESAFQILLKVAVMECNLA